MWEPGKAPGRISGWQFFNIPILIVADLSP